MKCPIEESIAIKADEPEQESAWEKFQYLEEYGFVYINSDFYYFTEITEMLYDDLEVSTLNERNKLYIDKIAELMDE